MRTPNKKEILEILILQHTDSLGFGESCEIVFDRELENEEITIASDEIHKLRSVLPPVNKRTRRFEQESI